MPNFNSPSTSTGVLDIVRESLSDVFDVIIIGGRAAGCVVAGRLIGASKASVLLLDTGSDDVDPLIHLPASFAKSLQYDLHVWRYETVAQEQLDGATRRFRAGKVVGGGSSINAMCYVRGQAHDYGQWQMAVGDTGPGPLPTCFRIFAPRNAATPFVTSTTEQAARFASMPRGINELNLGCMRAFQEFGLPYNPNYNGASQVGVSPVQFNISESRRCSSADAFLRPAQASGRLDVRVDCTVTRIVIEEGKAVGVE